MIKLKCARTNKSLLINKYQHKYLRTLLKQRNVRFDTSSGTFTPSEVVDIYATLHSVITQKVLFERKAYNKKWRPIVMKDCKLVPKGTHPVSQESKNWLNPIISLFENAMFGILVYR